MTTARRGPAPAQPAAIRNGIRLFPVRPDAGPVTPELVKTLADSSYGELQEWQIQQIKAGIREADAGDFASDDEVAAVFAKWPNAR